MKITKFEHACFIVEENGQSLIVDPGAYTTDLVIPDHVIGIVITHEHPDHWSDDQLKAIVEKNPDVVIYAHEDVTSQLNGYTTKSVVPNEGIRVGNFELEFFGGQHAVITSEIPVIANLGVMINHKLYYPGDSFTLPDQSVDTLALPIAAPWMKFSEAAEFLKEIKPRLAFPTHDVVLSDIGKSMPDRMMPPIAEKVGASYQRLQEPLEI